MSDTKDKISVEKFLEAEKVIQEYNNELWKAALKEHDCVCCKTNKIKPLYAGVGKHSQFDARGLHNEMWGGGIVTLASAGYGSDHDGQAFYVAICDACITSNYAKGIIKNLYDIEKQLRAEID